MGSMRKSRLSRFKQSHLVEHFVAGTTARTAASLCGVNRKTAALYFLRLREIIAYELEAESAAMFGGEIEVARAISVAGVKASGGGARPERSLCLGYLSGAGRTTPRSFQTLPRPH